MWSRQQRIVDFHLYTSCEAEESQSDSPPKSVHLHLTRSLISARKYLKQVAHEEYEEYEETDKEEDAECPSYSDEEALKGELTTDQQKLANRLSTIAIGDFECSSDSDASESGRNQSSQRPAGNLNSVDDRLRKYLDGAACLNGISEESPDVISAEEKEASEDWERSDTSALMEAMGLPLNFGRVRPKKTKKKKLTEKEIRKKFTNLWEQNGELMVYKSFVSIYPDYAGYYDEITGSIPPCVEIEITEENPEYTSETFYYSNQEEDENDSHMNGEDAEVSQSENATETPTEQNEDISHLSDGLGDASTLSDKNISGVEETTTKDVTSNHTFLSDSGDCNGDHEITGQSRDSTTSSHDDARVSLHGTSDEPGKEPTNNMYYSVSYCFSEPKSTHKSDHCYGVKQKNVNNEHDYSANGGTDDADAADTTSHEVSGGSENYSHDVSDGNENYSHDEFISMLRGTHDDLKNQIYWHVKETSSAWYRDHPNQKFNIASLDEDLYAIAQPYILQTDQWEEGEYFDAGEVHANVSQNGDDEEEEEELVDGSYPGDKIEDTLEVLGLAVSRDTGESISRKRKIVHGTLCVRHKAAVKTSKYLDFGKEPFDFGEEQQQEEGEEESLPASKHFIFDDDGDPVQIKAKHGVDERTDFDVETLLQDTDLPESAEEMVRPKNSGATEVPSFKGLVEAPPNKGTVLCSYQDVPSNYKRSSKKKDQKLDGPTAIYHHNILFHNPSLTKYWRQRYTLFSKFDLGVRLDKEGWYSVTPEPIAAHIAKRLACETIVDGFCGVGGNTIQFALTCKRVIAVDIDRSRLDLARHNARIYGVEHKIEFIHADFLKLASTLTADVVYLSPPWGGPEYSKKKVYDLEDMAGFKASSLYSMCRKISGNIALTLPKNCDTAQIATLPDENDHVEYEQVFLDNKLKMVNIYFGDLTGHIKGKYYYDTAP